MVARKPLAGTVAGNVLEHGTGALNVDGCRIGTDAGWSYPNGRGGEGWHGRESLGLNLSEPMEAQAGRWPANVVLDEEAAAMLDEQSGDRPGMASQVDTKATPSNYFGLDKEPGLRYGRGDSGGASRFFYVAKASRAERNAGLEGFEERTDKATESSHSTVCAKCGRQRVNVQGECKCAEPEWVRVQQRPSRNHHPTVKPIALMRWLVRLVTPPSGLVLDPFTGSGTTGIACALEGFDFLGMEQDEAYAAIAEARIAWWAEHGEDALRIVGERERAESERAELSAAGQLELL